ncbi:unnamed protein product [Clavelina lepadiformis]|uniref:HNH endonuclease n=1 Tax=Clavelina lepadiformis TaxID=159417 RepID=A0ABP0F5S9_CLALP
MHLEWGDVYFGRNMGKKGILPAIPMGKNSHTLDHLNGRKVDEWGGIKLGTDSDSGKTTSKKIEIKKTTI